MAAPRKKPKRRIGRNPDTTIPEALVVQIETLLANCTTVLTACEATGVNHRTFYRWLEMAESDDPNLNPKYRDFAARITKARGLAKAKLVQTMVKAAPTDWRAADALLKAIAPEEYGIRERLDVNHKGKLDHEHRMIHVHIPASLATPRPQRTLPHVPLPPPPIEASAQLPEPAPAPEPAP